jgi:two-component system phosphate regulon response regulator PhoB
MRARILIVDDQHSAVELLKHHLKYEGFLAEHANDGDEAELLVSEQRFDLVILDSRIVKRTGNDLYRRLRNRSRTRPLPILLLAERGDVGVRSLTIGADDHATKPLSAHELIGPVRGLLRRSAPERASYILVSGDIVLDRRMRKVARGDREISMAASEYRLLEVFLEKPRQVLSRSYLLDHVWGQDADVDERTVDVYVGRLRKSLMCENEFDPIRTVRGAGYVFDGRSRREPAKAEREPVRSQS